jgi:YbgA-like uncharacterized protein
MGRLERERDTIEAMMRLYCRAQHGTGGSLCPACRSLLDYTAFRILKCPHKENKPSCASCTIHCFRAGRFEEIRAVMRFAGPRMWFRHPLLSLLHTFDRFRASKFRKSGRSARSRPAADANLSSQDDRVSAFVKMSD